MFFRPYIFVNQSKKVYRLSRTLIKTAFNSGENCFEISQPNFYQLKISWEVNFSQILMGIAWKMVLPRPWPFETSQGRGRLIFWATTSKFGEKTHLLMIFKWYEIMFLIPPLISDSKKSGWAAPYIPIACTWSILLRSQRISKWGCNFTC